MAKPDDPLDCDELDVALSADTQPGAFRSVTTYRVTGASRPDVTEASHVLPFAPEDASGRLSDLARALRRRAARGVESASDVQTVGAALFECLFKGPLHRLYAAARARADESRAGLQLRFLLPPSDPALPQRGPDDYLGDLPWEALYDTSRNDFLALSPRVAVARVRMGDGLDPRPPRDALVVAVSRAGQDGGTEAEVEALCELVEGEGGKVRLVESPSADRLAEALRQATEPVVYFIGYTEERDDEPFLILSQEDGAPLAPGTHQLRPASWLVELLRDHEAVRLVFLRAPGSARFAKLLFSTVPAVVGFRDLVKVDQASTFAGAFLGALLGGATLEVAASQGRSAMDRAAPGSRDWALPVLYVAGENGGLAHAAGAPWPESKRLSEPGPAPRIIEPEPAGAPPALQLARARARIAQANVRELRRRAALLRDKNKGDWEMPAFVRQQLDVEEERLRDGNRALEALGDAPLEEPS